MILSTAGPGHSFLTSWPFTWSPSCEGPWSVRLSVGTVCPLRSNRTQGAPPPQSFPGFAACPTKFVADPVCKSFQPEVRSCHLRLTPDGSGLWTSRQGARSGRASTPSQPTRGPVHSPPASRRRASPAEQLTPQTAGGGRPGSYAALLTSSSGGAGVGSPARRARLHSPSPGLCERCAVRSAARRSVVESSDLARTY